MPNIKSASIALRPTTSSDEYHSFILLSRKRTPRIRSHAVPNHSTLRRVLITIWISVNNRWKTKSTIIINGKMRRTANTHLPKSNANVTGNGMMNAVNQYELYCSVYLPCDIQRIRTSPFGWTVRRRGGHFNTGPCKTQSIGSVPCRFRRAFGWNHADNVYRTYYKQTESVVSRPTALPPNAATPLGLFAMNKSLTQ